MISDLNVRSLYPLALAEGEGVGTAYEYVAKRRVLRPYLQKISARRVLIAGLPERYGASLDYVLLAEELETELVVVDDRPEALTKAEQALANARTAGILQRIIPDFRLVHDLSRLPQVTGPFDVCICNEVLQRLQAARRPAYARRLIGLGSIVALFAPNGENDAHTTHSGLSGIALQELQILAREAGGHATASGYCDLPPFPPGITRSEEQRAQAATGLLEAVAMQGLTVFAHAERWLPTGVKRRRAHIVYTIFRK